MTSLSPENSNNRHDQWILVGYTLKAYGLLGEIKVKPESFDLERHEQLETVLFHKKPIHKKEGKGTELSVISSRLHQGYWYLKFEGYKTPESIKPLSGGHLYIPEEERLELPDDMIYTTDMIGYQVFDISKGTPLLIGTLRQIQEYPNQDILVVTPSKKTNQEILIPWIEVFVKEINEEQQTIHVNMEMLEGLYEN